MAEALIDALHAVAMGGARRTFSAVFDEHERGAGRAMDAAFSAVLWGLEQKTSDSRVMGEVARLIGDRDNDPASLLDVDTVLRRGATAAGAPTALGAKLVDVLFGKGTRRIGEAVARASGVGASCGAAMLPAAGALVLAMFGKRLGTGTPSVATVAGIIASERDTLQRVVPGYLKTQIAKAPEDDGGRAGAAALPKAESYGSLLWLLIPMALLGALVWILMSVLGTSTDTREAAAPPARTSDRDRARSSAGATGNTGTSASSDWDAATSTATAARKAPPLAGLDRMALANGTEIDIVPETSVERKMVDFINDRWASIDKGRWFDFDRIRFRSGSADLTPGSKVQLRNTAAIMKAYPDVNIKIGGYTDNVGDPAANLRLSDDRSKRVMAELVKLGVAAERLEAEGYGDQHAIADNATPDGRAKNRRTAVSIRAK